MSCSHLYISVISLVNDVSSEINKMGKNALTASKVGEPVYSLARVGFLGVFFRGIELFSLELLWAA